MSDKFKGKKHFRTFVCLGIGIVLLTGSVYANYDNATGYMSYKNAAKKLLLEEETIGNYTLSADVSVQVDGKEMAGVAYAVKTEGEKESNVISNRTMIGGHDSDSRDEYYFDGNKGYSYFAKSNTYYETDYNDGNKGYSYFAKSNTYYETDYNPVDKITLEVGNDETAKKAATFAETICDTFVGDLKNSFVLISEEDGVKNYNVTLKKSQMPEFVNAGISLLFGTMDDGLNNRGGWTVYEDYDKTMQDYYKSKTGEEWMGYTDGTGNVTDAEWDKYWDVVQKCSESYEEIIDRTKGRDDRIVYVKADGSYEIYDNYIEYRKANAESGNVDLDDYFLISIIGNDPEIELATCDFSIDSEGRLLSNRMEGTLKGKGADGEMHTITLLIDINAGDYGTTKADVFDPAGKKNETRRYQ